MPPKKCVKNVSLFLFFCVFFWSSQKKRGRRERKKCLCRRTHHHHPHHHHHREKSRRVVHRGQKIRAPTRALQRAFKKARCAAASRVVVVSRSLSLFYVKVASSILSSEECAFVFSFVAYFFLSLALSLSLSLCLCLVVRARSF